MVKFSLNVENHMPSYLSVTLPPRMSIRSFYIWAIKSITGQALSWQSSDRASDHQVLPFAGARSVWCQSISTFSIRVSHKLCSLLGYHATFSKRNCADLFSPGETKASSLPENLRQHGVDVWLFRFIYGTCRSVLWQEVQPLSILIKKALC